MVVLAGAGGVVRRCGWSALRIGDAPISETARTARGVLAYSSHVDDLQLTVTGVQIELGPGYVVVSSVDGSAAGTLDRDAPNATYRVAMRSRGGDGARSRTARSAGNAELVSGGLTGVPGGGPDGAQASSRSCR